MPRCDTFEALLLHDLKLYLLLLTIEHRMPGWGTPQTGIRAKYHISKPDAQNIPCQTSNVTTTMKQLFALALFLLTALALPAQKVEAKPPAANTSANDAAAREATDKLVAKYTLNADQSKTAYTIQQRKLRNLGEIASLQSTNRSLYLSKLESIQKGTLASIRRMLRTKEQVELYNKTQADVRNQRAMKRKELASQRPAKDDLQAALLEIYAE